MTKDNQNQTAWRKEFEELALWRRKLAAQAAQENGLRCESDLDVAKTDRYDGLLFDIFAGEESPRNSLRYTRHHAWKETLEHVQRPASALREDAPGLPVADTPGDHEPLRSGDIILLFYAPSIAGFHPERSYNLYMVGSTDAGIEGHPETATCDLFPCSVFDHPACDGEVTVEAHMIGEKKSKKTKFVLQAWNYLPNVAAHAINKAKIGHIAEPELEVLDRVSKAAHKLPIPCPEDKEAFTEYYVHAKLCRDVLLQRLGGYRYSGGYSFTDKAKAPGGYYPIHRKRVVAE